jgi:hypothetical protein
MYVVCQILSNGAVKSRRGNIHVVESDHVIIPYLGTASYTVLPKMPRYWLECNRIGSIYFVRFAAIRARILWSVFSKVIGLQSQGVVGVSVFPIHTTMRCICCSMIQSSTYIWYYSDNISNLVQSQKTL